MAEAIGLATSIVGLIDATTKIIHYVNTVQDAQKEATQFASEASINMCLLFRLKQRLDDPSTSKGWRGTVSQSLGDLLVQVEAGLSELIHELRLNSTSLKKLGRKFLWPITKGDIKDILDRIHRLNTLVALALDDDLIELITAVKSDTTAIREDTAPIKDIKDEMGGIANHAKAAVDSAKQKAHEQRHQKIVYFIASHDFGSKLGDFLSNRQPGTGAWFVQAPEFQKWLETDGGILWCPGIPGAGKTTLIATAIDYLQSHFRSDVTAKVIYAFCDYKDRGTQTVRTVLASLWGHLMKSRLLDERECKNLEKNYLERTVQPAEIDMLDMLRIEIARYPRVFILLDALDEFNSDHREDLLVALQRLGPTVNLLITSRYIVQAESSSVRYTQQLRISAADADLRTYILGHLTSESRLGRHVEKDPKLAKDITNILIQRAQGMFLLAQLHLGTLSTKLNPKAVRKALNALPEGKDAMKETYDQALSRIETQNPDDRDLAERIITWLCYSLRPLTLSDLQYAVSFDTDDDEFGEDDLIPLDLILSVCGGLVISDSSEHTVQFVHYTTQEYFGHIQTVRFPYGHADLAKTCLKFLCLQRFAIDHQKDGSVYYLQLAKDPLLEYASFNWGHHVRAFFTLNHELGSMHQSSDEHNLIHIRKELEAVIETFTSSYHNLCCALCVLVYVTFDRPLVDAPRVRYYTAAKNNSACVFNSYAYFGLDDLIITLASVDSSGLYSSRDSFGNVLHWASFGDHDSTLNLLLKDYNLVELITERGYSGYHPLDLACEWNRSKAVKSLLNFGADPTYTALHLAASRGGNPEIISAILATSGGKNLVLCKDWNEKTSLHCSASHGSIEGTRLLLAAADNLAGVDVARLNCSLGNNPLYLAAARTDPAFTLAFLESSIGSQLASSCDPYNTSPFQMAIMNDNDPAVKLFIDWTREDLFGDYPDMLGSALHLAVAGCSRRVIDLLLDRYRPKVGFINQNGRAIAYDSSVARCGPRDERVEALVNFLRELNERDPLEKGKVPNGKTKWGRVEEYNFLVANSEDVLNLKWYSETVKYDGTGHGLFQVQDMKIMKPRNMKEERMGFKALEVDIELIK